jgi:hypothetical protein
VPTANGMSDDDILPSSVITFNDDYMICSTTDVKCFVTDAK